MSASSWALALACLLLTSSASAAPRRVAIVVGNNRAGPDKATLRYAQQDARRVAALLRSLGRVDQVKLLLGRSARALDQALKQQEQAAAAGGKQQVLLFYYSGHADNSALLMGRTRFPFAALRQRLKRFPARTAIAFVDACQSGQITRTKGGRAVPVNRVQFNFDDGAYQGRVYVTSSAAGESSQESDRLGASYFTHYLLSALRGAADDSGDDRVSLQEAYQYAYRHTLARTAETLQGPQHPSYRMELSGEGQLVLTWLGSQRSHLVLPAAARGVYYVRHKGPSRRLVAEVRKEAARRLRLALRPGRYEVRKVWGRRHLAQTVTIHARQQTVLDEGAMVRVAPDLGVTKGGGPGAGGVLTFSYQLASGYLDQAGLLHGVALGYSRRLGWLDLGGQLGYSGSVYQRADHRVVDLHQLSLLVSAQARLLRWRWIQPAAGLDLGLGWVIQRGERPGAPPQQLSDAVFRYRLRVGAELPLSGPLVLGLWGHAGQVVLRTSDQVAAPFTGGALLSLSFLL